jgi:hypothetical protein
MSLHVTLKKVIKHNPVLWRGLYYPYMAVKFKLGMCGDWPERIQLATQSSDNAFIPRVPDAGRETSGYQIMHNGIRTKQGSYYGYLMARLLRVNKGVHEPQEERVFAEVLKHIQPGAQMLELGAYWSFYSMWFNREIKGARNVCVEPDQSNMQMGIDNFALNGLTADFENGYVGAEPSKAPDGIPIVSVDDVCARHKLTHLAMLHSDIQGYEVEMLRGAKNMFTSGKVDYCFISTHSNQLHDDCRAMLLDYGHVILADANCDESFSADGLIASRRSTLQGLQPMDISKRQKS